MRIGELVRIKLPENKLKYSFPKRTGKLNTVPVYPAKSLSPEGLIKPFLTEKLPCIEVSAIVMFLGIWDQTGSNEGLGRVLYGDKVYGVLLECLEPIER